MFLFLYVKRMSREKVLNPFTGKMVFKDGATWAKVQDLLTRNVPTDVMHVIKSHADDKTKKKLNLTSKSLYEKDVPRPGTHNSKVISQFLKIDNYVTGEAGKQIILTSSKYIVKVTAGSVYNGKKMNITCAKINDNTDVPKVIGKHSFALDTKDSDEYKNVVLTDFVKGVRNQKMLFDVLTDLKKARVYLPSGWRNGIHLKQRVDEEKKFEKMWILTKAS